MHDKEIKNQQSSQKKLAENKTKKTAMNMTCNVSERFEITIQKFNFKTFWDS